MRSPLLTKETIDKRIEIEWKIQCKRREKEFKSIRNTRHEVDIRRENNERDFKIQTILFTRLENRDRDISTLPKIPVLWNGLNKESSLKYTSVDTFPKHFFSLPMIGDKICPNKLGGMSLLAICPNKGICHFICHSFFCSHCCFFFTNIDFFNKLLFSKKKSYQKRFEKAIGVHVFVKGLTYSYSDMHMYLYVMKATQ